VTREDVLAGRALFRPKIPECETPCPSCPFSNGNDKEFGAVMNKLAVATGEEFPVPTSVSRARVRMELQHNGDFICHFTAYNIEDMSLKPRKGHRQCPGATKWYKTVVTDGTLRRLNGK